MAKENVAKFLVDESGAVAATYALGLIALIAIAGVGFDYARMAGMHTELQNAADQAALAGASQLDQESGACSRAANAAASLLTNETLLGRVEGGSLAVSIATETACDATGKIRFWQDADKTTAATSDATAFFIEVVVDERTADYALTPIVGLLDSGGLDAGATAGVASAVCEVPPLMICLPTEGLAPGIGIEATSHVGGNTWGPGDFGFLEVGSGSIADLAKAIAYEEVPLDCVPVDGTLPETGNAQELYEAFNTRFDIYPQGNQAPLNACRLSGACPAAPNQVKDLVQATPGGTTTNQCRIGSQGWQLPENQFSPGADAGQTNPSLELQDEDGRVDAMGYSRDLCHYLSFGGGDCDNSGTVTEGDRFGDGEWPRADYFYYNHGVTDISIYPEVPDWTRYETYLWERNLLPNPDNKTRPTSRWPNMATGEVARPVCEPAAPSGTVDRRVITVAAVTNCASLSGGSVAIEVDEWWDMFLVEPIISGDNGRDNDEIYLEAIRETSIGTGSGGGSQAVRRDVPYLVR